MLLGKTIRGIAKKGICTQWNLICGSSGVLYTVVMNEGNMIG